MGPDTWGYSLRFLVLASPGVWFRPFVCPSESAGAVSEVRPMSEREIDLTRAVEELWTRPQSELTEVFPSMKSLAGVWDDKRRAAAVAWLEEPPGP